MEQTSLHFDLSVMEYLSTFTVSLASLCFLSLLCILCSWILPSFRRLPSCVYVCVSLEKFGFHETEEKENLTLCSATRYVCMNVYVSMSIYVCKRNNYISSRPGDIDSTMQIYSAV